MRFFEKPYLSLQPILPQGAGDFCGGRAGVRIMGSSVDEIVSPDAIKKALGKSIVGRSQIYVDTTTSTNDEAKKLAEDGAIEGTVIIAGEQSAGRGRLGREWISPRGGIWISLILRPPSIGPLQKLTLMGGLSVAKSLKDLYGINAALKWPNDVLVAGKKICGVLAEGAFEGEVPLYIVMGIGINANIDLKSMPKEIGTRAVSIRKLLGHDISLNELITGVLKRIDADYALFARGEDESLMREYEKLCATIGQDVRIVCGEETFEGRAMRISPEGGLIVRTKGREETTVLAGDCIHIRKKSTRTRKNIKVEGRKLRH
jgi:BirA family biotin operon repressor/biotin-[acetyl-CoA-carboxylase] ligase